MEVEQYLSRFNHGRDLSLVQLWKEMDRVWDDCGLDNRQTISAQDINRFYAHPVWILNGLFAKQDPASCSHRKAIAEFIARISGGEKIYVADYGGGSGVLADIITDSVENVARVDVIEPWPSDYFCQLYRERGRIKFSSDLGLGGYDVVVAQDVLEHVEDPIDTALDCIDATRIGGWVVFANCFRPVIKCHLPRTFYLRHTFKYVLRGQGLKYWGVVHHADHAMAFRKVERVRPEVIMRRARLARLIGPSLNAVGQLRSLLLKRK